MEGGTPLAVADNDRIIGVIYLKDTVKPGIKAKFEEMRRAGIRTVMITGDNRSPPRRSPPRPASTTSSPRRSPRTRCSSSATSRRRAASSR